MNHPIDVEAPLKDDTLWVQGHATNHIWGMLERDEASNSTGIGLRFDCGDSGTLLLSKQQAHDTIDTLNDLLSQML